MRHNGRVMVLAWRDKKIVKMITSLHQNQMVNVEVWQRGQRERVPQQKPACVTQYNMSMNGVDKLDQNLVYYPFIRRSAKWTKKFVTYLFEICMFNSFIIYKAQNPRPDCRTFLAFIMSVCRSWTSLARAGGGEVGEEAGGEMEEEAGEQVPLRAPYMRDPQSRLDASFLGHELVTLPPNPKKKAPTRRCRVCSRNGYRRETRWYCRVCEVPLCVGCNAVYHSRADYYGQ